MIKLFNFLDRLSRRAQRKEELRDAANVIADAVAVAKDQEIQEMKEALGQARRESRSARARLAKAVEAGHELIRIAGAEFEQSVDDMRKGIGSYHDDDHNPR